MAGAQDGAQDEAGEDKEAYDLVAVERGLGELGQNATDKPQGCRDVLDGAERAAVLGNILLGDPGELTQHDKDDKARECHSGDVGDDAGR